MKTRLDAGQFLNKDNYDFMIVASKNEGYCYSLVQALNNGLPIIATPCPVFEELGINENNSVTLNFDNSNADEVIDTILTKKFNFKYVPKKDTWDKVLCKGESEYNCEIVTIQVVKPFLDVELNENKMVGSIYETTKERAELIISHGFAVQI